MTQHPDPEQIMAWRDGELAATEAADVATHVAACGDCRALTDGWARIGASAAAWRVPDPPASIAAAVRAGVRDARPRLESAPAGRGFWRRYWWQPIAATALVAAILVGREESVCGEVLCRREAPASLVDVTKQADAAQQVRSAAGDAFIAWWDSVPQINLGLPQSTKIVVAWFLDYECPACSASDPFYEPLLSQYAAAHPGDVTVVIRDWPWNSDCNPNVPMTFKGHEASCAAAVAEHLASERGAGDAMKSWLFSHQGGTTIEDVRDAARTVGGVTDFDARYPGEVDTLRRELSALGGKVSSTPSCFVNGRLASEGQGRLLSPANLQRALDIELKR